MKKTFAMLSMTLLMASPITFIGCNDDAKEDIIEEVKKGPLSDDCAELKGTQWLMNDGSQLIYLVFLGKGQGHYALQNDGEAVGTMTYSYNSKTNQLTIVTETNIIFTWNVTEFISGKSMTLSDVNGKKMLFMAYNTFNPQQPGVQNDNNLLEGSWLSITGTGKATVITFYQDGTGLFSVVTDEKNDTQVITFVYQKSAGTVVINRLNNDTQQTFTVVSLTDSQLVLRNDKGEETVFEHLYPQYDEPSNAQ